MTINYIYFKGSSVEFNLLNYFCIKSFHYYHPDIKIRIHLNFNPYQKSTEALSRIIDEVNPEIVVLPEDIYHSIHGNPVVKLAHKADYYRFNLMYDEGGLYSDLDALILKRLPIEKFIESNVPVLSSEHGRDPEYPEEYGRLVGICIGFIYSPKNNEFFKKVLDNYKTFDAANGHKWGVRDLVDMYYEDPFAIKLLDQELFNYPLYTEEGLTDIFKKELDLPRAWILHCWESQSKKFLNTDFQQIDLSTKSTFTKYINKII